MTQQSNPTNWRPPDGLGYSSLRPVRLTAQGIAMLVAGAIFLLSGPVLSYVIANQIRHVQQRDALLARQGVETTAEIIRLWRTGGEDDRHMVSYRFTAADRQWTNQVSVPRRIWSGLRTGAPLPIRYLHVPARREPPHAVELLASADLGILAVSRYLLVAAVAVLGPRPAPGATALRRPPRSRRHHPAEAHGQATRRILRVHAALRAGNEG